MKVRNIIRKAAVLGSAATMLGATVMGAMAYDLAEYPDKYIVDGNFDGKIVVGQKAATSDVLGAIDIAASLQAGSTTQEEVEIPGRAGEVTLTGDAFRLETSSDLLEIREIVGAVYDTLTSAELEALRGGSITTDEGSTDYYQYLRFGDVANSSTSGWDSLQPMAVNYAEDEDDVLADYLIIDDDNPFFEWEIEFTEGLESDTTGGELADLEDEVFNIFGTDFTFVDSSINTVSGAVTLEFMAGDVSDTLREGETKTYTIDGVDYEVTAVFISDPSSSASTAEAKFAVNGELTDGLSDGDTDTLSNGLQIGVRDLLVNSREGVVEFFLGANKIEFTDSSTSSESFATGVEIGNENIEDATLSIIGSFVNADNSTFEITNIKYRLSADASVGSTIYVPAGHGVREFLDEPVGLLSPTFDIQYQGLKEVATNDIEFSARSDHSYDLRLTNLRGKEYDFPLLTNKSGTFKWGDDDDDFWFVEAAAPIGGDEGNMTATSFFIGDDDYFLLSEGDQAGGSSEKDDSAVLRYEDIDTSDRILTFTDMATGESKEVSYQTCSGGAGTCGATSGDIIGIASNFVVEGNTYTIWVGKASLNSLAYPLAIDLNGDGDIAGAETTFTVKGGGYLNFGSQTAGTSTASSPQTMMLTTPANQFDDSSLGTDTLTWTVFGRVDSEVGLSYSSYSGPLENSHTSYSPWGQFEFINDNNDDDYDRGLTDYGAMVEVYDPTGTNDAEELTINYPEGQVGAQVFVVAGVTEASAGGAGAVLRDVVNPIAVGLAVLDKDAPALGDENLIIVGGPCANTVAASFLGNPTVCSEGFEPGKAMISAKEYGSTVATLVAGYEAQETLGASYVLADYETYLGDVEGSEVEVIASDLSDLQVMTPSMDVGDGDTEGGDE